MGIGYVCGPPRERGGGICIANKEERFFPGQFTIRKVFFSPFDIAGREKIDVFVSPTFFLPS